MLTGGYAIAGAAPARLRAAVTSAARANRWYRLRGGRIRVLISDSLRVGRQGAQHRDESSGKEAGEDSEQNPGDPDDGDRRGAEARGGVGEDLLQRKGVSDDQPRHAANQRHDFPGVEIAGTDHPEKSLDDRRRDEQEHGNGAGQIRWLGGEPLAQWQSDRRGVGQRGPRGEPPQKRLQNPERRGDRDGPTRAAQDARTDDQQQRREEDDPDDRRVEGQRQVAEGVGGDRREDDQDRDREHDAELAPALVAGGGEDGDAADHGDRHRQEQGDV